MYNKKISEFISTQVPEYIKNSGTMLLDFLKLYYAYVESRSDTKESAVSLIRNHSSIIDIDTTLDRYIDNFYSTYANSLPKSVRLNRRTLIKLLNEIYDSKGTEKSYKLLFKVLFGDEIDLIYPNKQILRASDGKWVQDSFITVRSISTANPLALTLPLVATIKSVNSEYDLSIIRIINVSTPENPNTFRFYFKSTANISINSNHKLYVYSSGVETYSADIIKSNTTIGIVTPGKDWRIGQVFKISGTISDTICRVNSIDSSGGITGIEIVEYGHDHDLNRLVSISPYPFAPISTQYEILIQYFPNTATNEYTLNIKDSINSISDASIGLMEQQFGQPSSYFLENYMIGSDYLGTLQFATSDISAISNIITDESDLSVDAWLASKATFVIRDNYLVKTLGYYSKDDGILSNQTIRLQDSYYYQLFSYVINTSIDVKLYEATLDAFHPAGLKRFSNLNKIASFENQYELFKSLSVDNIDVLDIVTVDETIVSKIFGKILSDATNPVTDSLNYSLSRSLSDSITINDNISINSDKYLSDTVTASHGAAVFSTRPSYFGEVYVTLSDQYDSYEQVLTIN